MGLSGHDRCVLDFLVPQERAQVAVAYRPHECSAEEAEAVKLAEQGDFASAIAHLDTLIARHPTIASLYNNRAQCVRLQGGNDKQAEEDLQRCLGLVSPEDGLTARQAHEQLGWLLFRDGRMEQAEGHFQEAAKLGSPEAKRMAVRCNPYAELCNAMFREAMAPYLFVKPPQ